jgi:hypothetical protein
VESEGHEGLTKISSRLSCNLKSFTIETWRQIVRSWSGSGRRWILNAGELIKKNGETTNTLSFSDEWNFFEV